MYLLFTDRSFADKNFLCPSNFICIVTAPHDNNLTAPVLLQILARSTDFGTERATLKQRLTDEHVFFQLLELPHRNGGATRRGNPVPVPDVVGAAGASAEADVE
jgi:hypothetical protein